MKLHFQTPIHHQHRNEPPGTISGGKVIKIAGMAAAWVALLFGAAGARFWASGQGQAGQRLKAPRLPAG